MITLGPSRGMRLPDYGLEVGDNADLVLLNAGSVHEGLRTQAERLAVIKRGKLVAKTAIERDLRI